MHFGAFLDRGWRQNDILWGRMDGAERILSTVLPSNERKMAALLEQAQLAILEEETDRPTATGCANSSSMA